MSVLRSKPNLVFGSRPRKDVLTDIEIVAKIQFLVDQYDTVIHRGASVFKLDRFSINQDSPRVLRLDASKNLHQSAFSGSVFADDSEDFAFVESQAHLVKRANTWK